MYQLPKEKVFLIGMPGCGKSSLARYLAHQFHRPYFDLDRMIEQQEQASIQQIFAERGEEGFRITESVLLRHYAFPSDAIVALGGGTPCFHNNMDWLLQHGTTIYIQTEVEVLVERLWHNIAHRPLLEGCRSKEDLRQKLTNILIQRNPIYIRAHLIWQQEKLPLFDYLQKQFDDS